MRIDLLQESYLLTLLFCVQSCVRFARIISLIFLIPILKILMYNYRMKKMVVLCLFISLICGALYGCAKDSVTVTPTATHYDVSFNVDALGLEVSAPDSITVESGKTVSAPILDVQPETGYTYIWTVSVSSRTEFDFSQPISADLTLSAVQVCKAYNITYLCGDGTNNVKNPATYTMADTVNLYNAEPRPQSGYKFLYWSYWDDASTQVFELEEGTMGDIVLRAVYAATTYDIRYEFDVTAGGVNSPDNPSSFTVEDEAVILEPASREGYVFKGWFIQGASGEGKGTILVGTLSAEFFLDNYDDILEASGSGIILEAHWEAADE